MTDGITLYLELAKAKKDYRRSLISLISVAFLCVVFITVALPQMTRASFAGSDVLNGPVVNGRPTIQLDAYGVEFSRAVLDSSDSAKQWETTPGRSADLKVYIEPEFSVASIGAGRDDDFRSTGRLRYSFYLVSGDHRSDTFTDRDAYLYLSPGSAYTLREAMRKELRLKGDLLANDAQFSDYYMSSMLFLELYLREALPQNGAYAWSAPNLLGYQENPSLVSVNNLLAAPERDYLATLKNRETPFHVAGSDRGLYVAPYYPIRYDAMPEWETSYRLPEVAYVRRSHFSEDLGIAGNPTQRDLEVFYTSLMSIPGLYETSLRDFYDPSKHLDAGDSYTLNRVQLRDTSIDAQAHSGYRSGGGDLVGAGFDYLALPTFAQNFSRPGTLVSPLSIEYGFLHGKPSLADLRTNRYSWTADEVDYENTMVPLGTDNGDILDARDLDRFGAYTLEKNALRADELDVVRSADAKPTLEIPGDGTGTESTPAAQRIRSQLVPVGGAQEGITSIDGVGYIAIPLPWSATPAGGLVPVQLPTGNSQGILPKASASVPRTPAKLAGEINPNTQRVYDDLYAQDFQVGGWSIDWKQPQLLLAGPLGPYIEMMNVKDVGSADNINPIRVPPVRWNSRAQLIFDSMTRNGALSGGTSAAWDLVSKGYSTGPILAEQFNYLPTDTQLKLNALLADSGRMNHLLGWNKHQKLAFLLSVNGANGKLGTLEQFEGKDYERLNAFLGTMAANDTAYNFAVDGKEITGGTVGSKDFFAKLIDALIRAVKFIFDFILGNIFYWLAQLNLWVGFSIFKLSAISTANMTQAHAGFGYLGTAIASSPAMLSAYSLLQNIALLLMVLVVVWYGFGAAVGDVAGGLIAQKELKDILPRVMLAVFMIGFSVDGHLVSGSLILADLMLYLTDTLSMAILSSAAFENIDTLFNLGAKLSAGRPDFIAAMMMFLMSMVFLCLFLGAAFLFIARLVLIWVLVLMAPVAWLFYVNRGTEDITKTWIRMLTQTIGIQFFWLLMLLLFATVLSMPMEQVIGFNPEKVSTTAEGAATVPSGGTTEVSSADSPLGTAAKADGGYTNQAQLVAAIDGGNEARLQRSSWFTDQVSTDEAGSSEVYGVAVPETLASSFQQILSLFLSGIMASIFFFALFGFTKRFASSAMVSGLGAVQGVGDSMKQQVSQIGSTPGRMARGVVDGTAQRMRSPRASLSKDLSRVGDGLRRGAQGIGRARRTVADVGSKLHPRGPIAADPTGGGVSTQPERGRDAGDSQPRQAGRLEGAYEKSMLDRERKRTIDRQLVETCGSNLNELSTQRRRAIAEGRTTEAKELDRTIIEVVERVDESMGEASVQVYRQQLDAGERSRDHGYERLIEAKHVYDEGNQRRRLVREDQLGRLRAANLPPEKLVQGMATVLSQNPVDEASADSALRREQGPAVPQLPAHSDPSTTGPAQAERRARGGNGGRFPTE